jgi:hypothetical protein
MDVLDGGAREMGAPTESEAPAPTAR